MPRRSFTVIKLRVHKRGTSRADTSNDLALDQLPGNRDLLTTYEDCCRRIVEMPGQLDDPKQKVSTGITDIRRHGRRLFIDANIGEYSDGENLRNRVTGKVTYERERDDVAPIASRAVLMVPRAGIDALYFAEVSGHSSAGSRIQKHFDKYFRELFGEELTLISENVAMADEWIDAARLVQVKGYVYGWSPNGEDAEIPQDTELAAILQQRGGFLPRKLFNRLRNSREGRGKLLGLPADPDAVVVTMEGEGRRKEFDISEDKTPRLLIPLTGPGEQALPPAELMKKALSESKDIFKRVGVEWNTEWNEDSAG